MGLYDIFVNTKNKQLSFKPVLGLNRTARSGNPGCRPPCTAEAFPRTCPMRCSAQARRRGRHVPSGRKRPQCRGRFRRRCGGPGRGRTASRGRPTGRRVRRSGLRVAFPTAALRIVSPTMRGRRCGEGMVTACGTSDTPQDWSRAPRTNRCARIARPAAAGTRQTPGGIRDTALHSLNHIINAHENPII